MEITPVLLAYGFDWQAANRLNALWEWGRKVDRLAETEAQEEQQQRVA